MLYVRSLETRDTQHSELEGTCASNAVHNTNLRYIYIYIFINKLFFFNAYTDVIMEYIIYAYVFILGDLVQ